MKFSDEVKLTTRYEILDKAILDYLLSPTLLELFNDYKVVGFTSRGDLRLKKKQHEK